MKNSTPSATVNSLMNLIQQMIVEGNFNSKPDVKFAIESRVKIIETNMSIHKTIDPFLLKDLVTFVVAEYVYSSMDDNSLNMLMQSLANMLKQINMPNNYQQSAVYNSPYKVNGTMPVNNFNNNRPPVMNNQGGMMTPPPVAVVPNGNKTQQDEIVRQQELSAYVSLLKDYLVKSGYNLNVSYNTFTKVLKKFDMANKIAYPNISSEKELFKVYNQSL